MRNTTPSANSSVQRGQASFAQKRPDPFAAACPHCGGPIRSDATFCRHCGSSDEDGWREEADPDLDVDMDDFDYDEFVADHFDPSNFRTRTSLRWRIVAVLLLLLFLAGLVFLR